MQLTGNQGPRGAVRHARLPVKEKVTGSNPVGGAGSDEERSDGTVRKPAKRPSSNLGELWVRLPLVPMRSDAARRPRVVFLTAVCKTVAIKIVRRSAKGSTPSPPTVLLLDSMARWSIGQGHQPLTLKRRVRFPHGSLLPRRREVHEIAGWRNGRRAGLRSSSPWAWEFESPLGDWFSGNGKISQARQVSRRLFIRPVRPARYRGLGLAGGPVLGRVSYARRRWFDSPTRNLQCSWHGTQTGIAARLRVWCLWVRIPPVLLPPAPATCRQRPVVQRRRRLSHTEEMGVRLPPGRLDFAG